MKKKAVVLSVLALTILGATAVFFLTRPLSLSLEQIFPSGVLMYARLSHVAGDVEQFTQTIFWKNVSTIDLPMVLEHNSVSARDVKQLRGMQKEMGLFLKNPLTKKFLGKELAIGFYERSSNTKGALKSYDALFATRLGLSLQIAELFVSMAHQWSDDITTTTENYRGFNIVHVHFEKRNLNLEYTRIHDVLLVSSSPSSLMHQVLDIYQKHGVSLATDPDFFKSMSHAYPNGHGIFYVNIQKFYDLFRNHVPKIHKKDFKQISKLAFGFKSYVVSFLPGHVSKMKLIMRFDPDQLNPPWRSLFSCAPSANPSLKFVPHNVIAYQWGQCYDFKDLWAQMKEGTQSSPMAHQEGQKWKHRLEKRFKLNIYDDVLPVLGSQVGGYLNDVDIQGLFPYPRGVIFIKINNRLKAEDLMKKLTENPLTLIQEENYQQKLIHYTTLPFGANMDPGYIFLGDYLLLGSSRQLLKTSIDAFNNSNQSIQEDKTLKQFNINASGLSQGMAFIKINDVAGRLQQLLDWYNKIVSSQITMASTYQQEILEHNKELGEEIVSKKEDLKLAQRKLKELRFKVASPELPVQEQENEQANIDNLTSQAKLLLEDINSDQQQRQELHQTFIKYQDQSESAKVWLFNSDEVFMPFLKGLEGLHALGIQLHLGEQVSETEIYIK